MIRISYHSLLLSKGCNLQTNQYMIMLEGAKGKVNKFQISNITQAKIPQLLRVPI